MMFHANTFRYSVWIGLLVGFLCVGPSVGADLCVAIEAELCDAQVESRFDHEDDLPGTMSAYIAIDDFAYTKFIPIIPIVAPRSVFAPELPAIRAPPYYTSI